MGFRPRTADCAPPGRNEAPTEKSIKRANQDIYGRFAGARVDVRVGVEKSMNYHCFDKRLNISFVKNPFNVADSKNRPGVMLHGEWDDKIADIIRGEGIKALYLNAAKGWSGIDYSFLAQLPQLEELHILTGEATTGLSSISDIESLQQLSLTCMGKETLDFSRLSQLEEVYLYWWKGASSIFQCASLKDLYVDRCLLTDYDELGNLKRLKNLTVANSRICSLDMLRSLRQLIKLQLLNCRKVEDFSPIESLQELKWLTIEGCKNLSSLEFVEKLGALEVLNVSSSGTIGSVSPLKSATCLKAVAFAGNTVVGDGDLSVFTELPRLSMLMFAPKKHYSHKLIKPWSWKNIDQPDKLLQPK